MSAFFTGRRGSEGSGKERMRKGLIWWGQRRRTTWAVGSIANRAQYITDAEASTSMDVRLAEAWDILNGPQSWCSLAGSEYDPPSSAERMSS